MFSDYDQKRIKEDAYIAKEALNSLIYAENLNENYIKEKIEIVENCLKFIKYFENDNYKR